MVILRVLVDFLPRFPLFIDIETLTTVIHLRSVGAFRHRLSSLVYAIKEVSVSRVAPMHYMCGA